MIRLRTALALTAASALVLTGCAATPAEGGGDPTLVQVVASTNVYGSLAEQIGGDRVEVTSIITSVAQDPHSYEATARDRLAVAEADLLIENGGGYDHFMEVLREGVSAPVITAAEFSHDYPDGGHGHDHADEDHDHAEDDHADEDHADEEHDHDHAEDGDDDHAGHHHIEGFNEHVWFDAHTIRHVVEQIAAELTALDPAGEAAFAAAAATVTDELRAIEAEQDALHTEFEGRTVVMTEPLPGYLAAALGLDDVTPEGFAEAVEGGSDVAPATLLATLSLLEGGTVGALLTNVQTGGSETERAEEAAAASGVPIVAFSELLEPGTSYAEWMRDAMTKLADALRS